MRRTAFVLTLVVLALTGCSRVTNVTWKDKAPQGFDETGVVNLRKNPSESRYLCRDGTSNRDNNGVCSVIRFTPVRGLVPLNAIAEGFIDEKLTIYGRTPYNSSMVVFFATPGWFGRSKYTLLDSYDEIVGGAKASDGVYVLKVKRVNQHQWSYVTVTVQ